MKKFLIGAVLLASAFLQPAAQAALVGQWTFEGPNPLADSVGNFPDLLLKGNAAITNGQLDVNGTGTTATGWAVTSGPYTGPAISNKTMVSWLSLQSLCPTVCTGSALTLDKQTADYFDSLALGDGLGGTLNDNYWQNSSTNAARFGVFTPGAQETTTGSLIQIAFTYQDLGAGQMAIKGYRNGTLIGSYTTGNASSWPTGDAEVFFGARTGTVTTPIGAMDALIEEGRIYDTVLTQSEIQALKPVPGPLPVLGVLGGLHASRRLRQRIRATRG